MSFAMAEEAVNEVAKTATDGRLRLDIGGNLLDAVLGYLVVFIGLSLLMIVVVLVGKIIRDILTIGRRSEDLRHGSQGCCHDYGNRGGQAAETPERASVRIHQGGQIR